MTDLLDTHTAIVGASGAGKTVTAKGHVEALLDARRHVCIVDPTGAWFGLRSAADGMGPGFDIPIFGGPRGDVTITADQGQAIGAIIAGGVSAVVDLSSLRTGAEQRHFARDLFRALRKKDNGNFHVVVDEADEFAAQKPRDDFGFQVCEELIWMAKRGRLAGFVLTLITQRPASIDKEVLTQAQTIIVHQLVAPVDQKPIVDYLRDHADKPTLAQIKGSLASLGRGERWIYSPRANVLERGVSDMPRTFDSSRTPEPGELPTEPKMLASIDLSAIRAALETESDKAERKAMFEATGAPRCAGCIAKEARIAGLEAERDEWTVERGVGQQQLDDLANENARLHGVITAYQRGVDAQMAIIADISWPTVPRKDGTMPHDPLVIGPVVAAPPPASKAGRQSAHAGEGSTNMNAAARKMLEMLERIAPAKVPWGSLAAMIGNKARGGNFNAARKALRDSGLIIEDGDTVRSARPPAQGMTRQEAMELWHAVLSNPAPRMMDALHQFGPLTKPEIGEHLGIAARGGNFNNGIAQLIRNGVAVDRGGTLALANPLPGEKA